MGSTTSELARNLQAALDAAKLSGRAASLKAGLRHDTCRNILVGRSVNPKGETLSALAAALGTTPDAMLGRAPAPSRLSGDGVEISEYDVSPSADHGPDPRDRTPLASWRLPSSALPQPHGEWVIVRAPVNHYHGAGDIRMGDHLLVDVSASGRIRAPAHGLFLVFDGGAHGLARLSKVFEKDKKTRQVEGVDWELRVDLRPNSVSPWVGVVGRVCAVWNRERGGSGG